MIIMNDSNGRWLVAGFLGNDDDDVISIDYHIPFFISDPLSTLGSDISAQESVGSKADEESDMKKIFFIIYLEEDNISVNLQLQCDTNYG